MLINWVVENEHSVSPHNEEHPEINSNALFMLSPLAADFKFFAVMPLLRSPMEEHGGKRRNWCRCNWCCCSGKCLGCCRVWCCAPRNNVGSHIEGGKGVLDD